MTFRPRELILIILPAFILSACHPVRTTNARSKTAAGGFNSGNQTSTRPTVSFLALPSWCSQTQTADQVCFKCEREDAGAHLPYEQCLTPSESFKASTDCYFADDITKSITCEGTADGQNFVMDVSIARERASVAIPTFLYTLNTALSQKLPDRLDILEVVNELSNFSSNNIPKLSQGGDVSQISSDLMLLLQKYLKVKLTASEEETVKKSFSEAFTAVSADLSGKKDYSLSKIIKRISSASLMIPTASLGDAKTYLSPQYMADILGEDQQQTAKRSFNSLSPSMFGIKSAEDFITELKNGDL
jgi:hypothetical protein